MWARNDEFERQMLSGRTGSGAGYRGHTGHTLHGGGYGMPVIYTPAGVGTEVAGRETRRFPFSWCEERNTWWKKRLKPTFAIVKSMEERYGRQFDLPQHGT